MQLLAALYPKVRLSPWRTGPEKYPLRGVDPSVPPDLHSTQEGHPSLFPLVPSDWGICASPPETDQDSCPGWLPPVPLDLVFPQGGFLPLDLSAFLPPEFCPYFLCVFCVVPGIAPLCETSVNWKSLLIVI